MSYIGVPPFGQTVRTLTELTASAAQAVFNISGGYLPGYIDVYLNGSSLASSDFTATNGTTVTLLSAAAVGDEFKAIAYWPVSLVDTYRKAEVDSGFVAKTSATGAALLPTGTTAQRPASPTTGMVRFNTDLNYLEEYRDNTWLALSNVFAAEGGTVTTIGGYKIHTFTSSGIFNVLSGSKTVEYLVVAGGGGGGAAHAGGGGAGGYIAAFNTLSVGSVAITVGAGGAGCPGANYTFARGEAGSNSVVFALATAIGGGGGGSRTDNNSGFAAGGSGGSGGGGGGLDSGLGPYPASGGTGTSGQGSNGGTGIGGGQQACGGGGGGANAAGQNATSGQGGAGGAGKTWVNGSAYAGGGGGGAYQATVAGVGGTGGGGRGGGGVTISGTAGTANTGGGGGGGNSSGGIGGNAGFNGGSGIVIIRYPI